jgi:hypothetical protein
MALLNSYTGVDDVKVTRSAAKGSAGVESLLRSLFSPGLGGGRQTDIKISFLEGSSDSASKINGYQTSSTR